eukprot:gene18388-21463_t
MRPSLKTDARASFSKDGGRGLSDACRSITSHFATNLDLLGTAEPLPYVTHILQSGLATDASFEPTPVVRVAGINLATDPPIDCRDIQQLSIE